MYQKLNRVLKLLQYRQMIKALSLWELKMRYAGTVGGMLWSIILPLTMALVYWYVFAIGLRAQGPDDTPYIVWFMCGFIPWMSFNESMLNNVSSIVRNGHLVKNIIFPLEILPIINLLVSQVTQIIMLLILVVLLFAYHINITIYSLQFFYYFFALLVFSSGFSLILAAINVFYRDFGQALTVIMNIWFWITPIVWAPSMLSSHTQKLLLLNPMYYIVNGYRDSFIYHIPFWNSPYAMISFWMVSLLFLVIGCVVFARLKPDFADVL